MRDELPEGYKDALYTNVDIALGWRDRLRILFGYNIYLRVVNYVEQEQTNNQRPPTETRLSVFRPWHLRKPKLQGFAEAREHAA